MNDTKPGQATGVVGTFAAVIGAIVVLIELTRDGGRGGGVLIGSLLVIGGLLLRIEGAIRMSAPPD